MIHPYDMMQDIEKVLVSKEELEAGIQKMAKQIAEEYRGKCPIVVGLLKGVAPFYVTMTQSMDIPMQQDFMSVSSYEGTTASTGKLTIRKDLDRDIKGRHVLILEDILDSGYTLSRVLEILREREPASLKICTMLDKPSGRKEPLEADYACFTIPDGFVVGMGLDYQDYYRNLPFVGILKESVYSE